MLRIEIPMLPPTTNHAYTNNGFGGRTLSAAGKKFKNETKVIVARRYATAIKEIKPNASLVVLARFYFKSITNEGWPKKAKTRYKKLDATNRIKLLEDCLAEALGVDDSCNLAFIPNKCVGTPERTLVYIWSIEEEECQIYDAIQRC
jgi:Holliday junction resolvase RusA-like endonuclease